MSDISMGNKNSGNVSNSRIGKRALSIGLAAILVLSSIVVALPVNAQATVRITTSVDDKDNRFFGPAWVEVMIDSPAARNDNNANTLPVNITAFGASQTFNIAETSGSSGLFLIYLKVDADRTTAERPFEPQNPFSATHTRILIGSGTSNPQYGIVEELDVAVANIVNGGTITINVTGANPKTITYADSAVVARLDRSEYGPGSDIILQVVDQDANLDPTVAERIDLTGQITGDDAPAGAIVLTETGTNTGVFEITFQAGNLPANVTSTTRSLTINDYDVYQRPNPPPDFTNQPRDPNNPVGSTSLSYTVKLQRGEIQPLPTLSYASELPVKVVDVDQNTNSRSQQTLNSALRITINNVNNDYNLREDGLNSSTFVPAYSGNSIKLTFKQNTNTAQGILFVRPGTDVTVQYRDPNSDLPANSVTSERTFRLTNTPPQLSVDRTTVPRSAVITLTLIDPDLNDDKNIRESYTINFPANTNFRAFNAADGQPVFQLRIRINGAPEDLQNAFSVTFIEESNDSNKFIATVDLQQLQTALNIQFVDGTTIDFTIRDELDQTVTVFPDSKAEVTIGLPRPILTVDRTTVGVPRDPGEDDNINISDGSAGGTTNNISNLGPIVLRIRIEDIAMNRDSRSQETLVPQINTVNGGANNNVIDSNDNPQLGRLRLTFLNPDGNPLNNPQIGVTEAIRETGVDTGIFEGAIEVRFQPGDTPANWIGSRVRIEYAGPDGQFGTTDDADAVSVTFTARNAILQTDSAIIANGKSITITVIDPDANRDSDLKETVRVGLRWTNENNNVVNASFELEETERDSGIFSKKLDVGKTITDGQTVRVKADTEFRIRYYDLTPNIPGATGWPRATSSQTHFELTFRTTAITGSVVLEPAETVGPATRIKATIIDSDLNTNPAVAQNIQGRVTVASDRGAASRANLTVSETGPDTGIFEGKIRLNPNRQAGAQGDNTTEVTINVLPGDVVSVRYEDESGESGQRTFITKTVKVNSWDPEISFDKNSYRPGETIVLTIVDPDANRDADSNDILTVRVVSTSDPVGLTNVQVIETDKNSGTFVARIQTSSGVATGALMVKEGDLVTIDYRDDFPSDFRARFDAFGTLDAASKRFQATTTIGVLLAPTERTTVAKPSLRDQAGNVLTQASVDVPVSIASSIKNNTQQPQKFVYIVQVKDADGFVVSISTVGGTLPAGQSFDVSASWTPTAAGTYTVEVFVWSELGKPSPLSKVETATVRVV